MPRCSSNNIMIIVTNIITITILVCSICIKMFLQKNSLQIGLKNFLLLKKLKILHHGHVLFMILKEKKLLEHFGKTNCKKQIKKELRMEKVIKKKVINYMLNGKVMIISLIVGYIKKT